MIDTPIETQLRSALESTATEYEIGRELHDVPPHAVFEVIADGRRAVCKLARRPEADPAAEAACLDHVRRETSVPVPEVLSAGGDWFLAEWCDDVPPSDDAAVEVGPERARAMGACLARLHAETSSFDSYGTIRATWPGVSPRSDDAPSVPSIALDATNWPETLCTLLDACRDFLEPYGYAPLAREVADLLRERPGLLDGAGDPVLCHGNYLPASVGVVDGRVARVIDFEHALVGAGEYDVWATTIPTFDGLDDPRFGAFREGYESVCRLPMGFDRRREVYALVLLVTYLRSLYLQANWETREEADRRAERFATAAADRCSKLSE